MDQSRIYSRRTAFNDTQHTDTLSLVKAMIAKPAQLMPVITYLGGKETPKFPITMFTEGAYNTESIETDDYSYDVYTRERKTRPVAATPASTAGLGLGRSTFTVEFPDRWFINQYTLVSQSGVQARIMAEPVPSGSNWRYTLQLMSPDPNASVPADDVKAGALWAQLYAAVGQDYSRGNASNWQTSAKVTQKLGTVRKSYSFGGNAKNTVMEVGLPSKSGGTSKFWMDFEEWQHMLKWTEERESYYVYGETTYDNKGIVTMLDENNQPVIVPPGVLQQIVNRSTYAEMTENLLDSYLRDIFFGMTDGVNREILLMTGTGGAQEFDNAMKRRLSQDGWRADTNDKFVTGNGAELTLGGYFSRYVHRDGHSIRLIKHPLYDHGPVAQASRKHPVSGLPIESYRMTFLDRSVYDGQPNLKLVAKKGREFLRWAVAGSVIPNGFSGGDLRASDIDGASVHFLMKGHVLLRRWDTSFDLICDYQ